MGNDRQMTDFSPVEANGLRAGIKLILLGAGVFLTSHGFLLRIQYFLEFGLYFPLLVFVGIWGSAMVALVYLAFSPRRFERYAWAGLIGAATVFSESHYLVTGERITIQALDAMWDPDLINLQLMSFYGTYFLKAFLLTTPVVIGLLLPPPPVSALRIRVGMLLPLVPCLLLGGLVYWVGASEGNETRGMPSQFLNLGLFPVYFASEAQPLEKSEVTIELRNSPDVRNIVLVVDESVSGDFIDLNTPRGTTPFLLAASSSVVNFGLALSATNCSYSSNAILRLGADPDRIGQTDHLVLAHPTIWKYAGGAGFKTIFLEAHNISSRRQNYMNDKEIALIDEIVTLTDSDSHQRDNEIAQKLVEILQRQGRHFVLVNKFGAHFPYSSAYPEGAEVFTPAMRAYESITDRERLVNSYKNAVRWSVDGFFEALLQEADLAETVIIYTSDHGQNLLDDGQPVTHCRRQGETIAEAVVPLLVLTGNKSLRAVFMEAAAHNRNVASHFEIFPTILTLFGYDSDSVREQYHQSLLEPIDEPLGFVSGPVTGRFGRQPTWHIRDGLNEFERKTE